MRIKIKEKIIEATSVKLIDSNMIKFESEKVTGIAEFDNEGEAQFNFKKLYSRGFADFSEVTIY